MSWLRTDIPVGAALLEALGNARALREVVPLLLAGPGAQAAAGAVDAASAASSAGAKPSPDARDRGQHAGLLGLQASACTAAAAYLAREAAARGRGPLFYLAADASALDDAREDFAFLLDTERVAHFPDSGVAPYDLQIPRARQRAARIETLARLLPGEATDPPRPWVVLTTPRALFQRIPGAAHFARFVRTIRVGERLELDTLLAFLARLGYQPQPLVGEYGDFSRRGGIVDVYSFGHLNPVRIEFDDDEVVSLREFDVFSQRSKTVLSQFTLLPLWEVVIDELDWQRAEARGALPAAGPLHEHLAMLRAEGSFEGIEWMLAAFDIPRVSLLDFAGPDALVVADDPLLLEGRLAEAREEVPHPEEIANAGVIETPLRSLFSPPEMLFALGGSLSDLLRSHPTLYVGTGARAAVEDPGASAPRETPPGNKGWTAGEQLHPPDPLAEDPAHEPRSERWRRLLARTSARRGATDAGARADADDAAGAPDAADANDPNDGDDASEVRDGRAKPPRAREDGRIELPGYLREMLADDGPPADAAVIESQLIADGLLWSDRPEEALLLAYATRHFTLETRAQERFGRNLALTREYVERLHARGLKVSVLCDSSPHRERLEELMEDVHAIFLVGNLAGGFEVPELGFAILTDHEIFERMRRRRAGRRFSRGISLKELLAMRPGDFVVHIDHGVGVYRGIERLPVDGQLTDCMKLEYAGGDKLFIPVDQLNLVQKYSAEEGHRPALSRLGTGQWAKTKARVKQSIKEMAGELMKLYAMRKTRPGYAFANDAIWQTEMEARFPYEETPDQLKAIQEVKGDMEHAVPMDRLVCGDVGYGKTEVAIRAAFKCVMDGKQVIFLVPTTLLAQQHFDTVTERLKGYPVRIDMLSRFRTLKETRAVLAALTAGQVDLIIGTHRLLSKDVKFKDVGLIIVDEEHRFGVRHKERLKQLRTQVDVLTLTATPIPRTLNLALMGARDMSTIRTPPRDRRPIQTEITEFNDEVIAYALMREADRGGQSFFVHNRVESIDAIANYLRGLVPHLRIAVAHGQMRERQLEDVMRKFLEREFDVLVATMIIESGLDMPNVNTIVVNRTDTFGLAQLYQLRGRVGRSARKAYAYLLVPPARVITEQAMKRLKAIEEFEDLGSGFQLAMRDLEIRGAGNLLGTEQHGFILNVGFDLYTRLMEDAIRELRGEAVPDEIRTRLVTDMEAFLPDDYVVDSAEKMNLYKSLADAPTPEAVDELAGEVGDRFGRLPPAAANLFELRRLRIRAAAAGVEVLSLREGALLLEMARPLTRTDVQRLIGQMPVPVMFTTHGRHRVEVVRGEVRGESLLVAAQLLDCLSEDVPAPKTGSRGRGNAESDE